MSVVLFHLFLTHFIDFTQNFGIYSLAVRRQANFVSLKNHTSASREEEKWRKPRRYFARNLSKNIWRKQSFQYYQSNKFNNYNYFNDKNLIMWFEQYDFPQCLSISVFPVSIPVNFRGNFHFITCYSLVNSLMDFSHKRGN